MKKSRFSEAQILAIIQERESGLGVAERSRPFRVSALHANSNSKIQV